MLKVNTFFRGIIIFVMLSVMAASCVQRDVVFYKYTELNSKGWDTCSYVNMYFFCNDSAYPDLDVSVELRSTSEYEYANLWLEVLSNIKDSTVYEADTLELRLAADNGARLGTLSTGLYTISSPFKEYHNVPPGKYNIRIRHLMSSSPLRGIREVGVKVEKAE